MAQREHVRVRVINRAFCVDNNCRSCLMTLFDGHNHEAECSRADCDNHLREEEDELPPTPLHGLVKLPAPNSTQPLPPETPFSPE